MLFSVSMGKTGSSHDIFFEFSLRPVVEQLSYYYCNKADLQNMQIRTQHYFISEFVCSKPNRQGAAKFMHCNSKVCTSALQRQCRSIFWAGKISSLQIPKGRSTSLQKVKLRALSGTKRLNSHVVPVENWQPQFFIQMVFRAPLCNTLTISDQNFLGGRLFLKEKRILPKFY